MISHFVPGVEQQFSPPGDDPALTFSSPNVGLVTYISPLFKGSRITITIPKRSRFRRIARHIIINDKSYGSLIVHLTLALNTSIFSSWWLNHPSPKCAHEFGSFPQFSGWKIKNIWVATTQFCFCWSNLELRCHRRHPKITPSCSSSLQHLKFTQGWRLKGDKKWCKTCKTS